EDATQACQAPQGAQLADPPATPKGWGGAQPGPQYAGLAGAISKALLGRTTEPGEARALIAALLSLVTLSMSLLPVFAGWLIGLTVPGLGLAGWSLWQWYQSGRRAAELCWLGVIGLVLNAGWPVAWLVALAVATHH